MTADSTIPPEALSYRCDASRFAFETTDELESFDGVIGQPRALEAIRFGIGIRNEGYNIFVLGRHGSGKHSAVRQLLAQEAGETRLSDWCYVNNFDDPTRPRLLRLPAGMGARLAADMDSLVDELQIAIPALFEGEDYQRRLQAINQEFEQRQQAAFAALQEKTEANDIRLFQQPGEFTFAAVRDGKVLTPDAFARLPKEEQQRIEAVIAELQAELEELLRQRIPQWQRERRRRIRQLNDEVARQAVGRLLEALRDSYREFPETLAYLEAVEADLVNNIGLFREAGEEGAGQGAAGPFERYAVNLLIDNGGASGPPLVYEDNPTHPRLMGRAEYLAQFGALLTDFTLIKPGALHRANGGYLLLDARKVLEQPFSWQALKRALFARQLRIESLVQAVSPISTVTLEPDPMPLDVKVVLLGDRLLYYLLCDLDPEFSELFKVAADFDDVIERSAENEALYARVLATLVRKAGLRHLRRDAVAAVIERAARLAAEEAKLSTHMRSIADLLAEANHWAGERDSLWIEAADVQRAVEARRHRLDRYRERLYEEIGRGVLRIDTRGEVIGQVNGLTVIEGGDYAFGVPTRITATTRLGEGEVIDIEREVDLAGPVHSKGVFILSSFLAARYSANYPLSLAASLTFEQSYGGVEGDSASLAELCALLSSLASVPVRQGWALTGSVDQLGQVQAVGGVNEKIEGFFAICQRRGLDGSEGVIIPRINLEHLMLDAEVREAVAEGRFAVHAVEHVDQAMQLLTGMAAGEADAEGNFPDDSLNGRVQQRLMSLANIRHAFAGHDAAGHERRG
ncbi:AAA family ATPase [Thiohalobacter sp. IOR34]|uniref:Lon protease family protein n=1 Tax=Thiohalobacter sp. IOR34 TaxID=3057176 RepID=UPI0025B23870|nr:ATP-binding protein [Thiohalobacter sp. IOR34]WJW76634.1 AAA family ATPase [Thiohalobacter sp. IOR34]